MAIEHGLENSNGEFARFISDEIDRALVRLGIAFGPNELDSGGRLYGSDASLISAFPSIDDHSPSASRNHLADLASKLVHAIAAEAVRRSRLNDSPAIWRPVEVVSDSYMSVPEATYGPSAELGSMLMEDWAGQVVGQTYLEEKLRIPRSTLHLWKRRNEVIALRAGRRKHVFPLAQFVDGRPVPGIRDVLSLIANQRLAWYWLIRPSADLDGGVPIEMLRRDRVLEVTAAARAFSQGKEALPQSSVV